MPSGKVWISPQLVSTSGKIPTSANEFNSELVIASQLVGDISASPLTVTKVCLYGHAVSARHVCEAKVGFQPEYCKSQLVELFSWSSHSAEVKDGIDTATLRESVFQANILALEDRPARVYPCANLPVIVSLRNRLTDIAELVN
ncbi:hypothetical protein GUITHDRAFT_101233 [Guillardia theta CCMP2712]|uniref:Uncharacterized protein n=2 Tax=Guillardia theta TaxID=55529 RepID=L1JXI3_GUITC|nr:hypothetical protein GUITHDRAFT_101233 [Guillardia theta CCMP2712]EKX52783.1 hypothetical protein GUITHDRAFT_101233 [Guillardia theta CCMP2712]|eukprot:XP_005839763.1 hypothetical protein GUITHDRAFT_101233 [Guillardia theta CCMP2712]